MAPHGSSDAIQNVQKLEDPKLIWDDVIFILCKSKIFTLAAADSKKCVSMHLTEVCAAARPCIKGVNNFLIWDLGASIDLERAICYSML